MYYGYLVMAIFGTYVEVLAPFYPQAIPELMAYVPLVIRCSQDYKGLAWVRYDMSFHRQAAASGNRNWSKVNSSLYSICFDYDYDYDRDLGLRLGSLYTHSNTYNKYTSYDNYINYETQIYSYKNTCLQLI